jgi:hypothetical protein
MKYWGVGWINLFPGRDQWRLLYYGNKPSGWMEDRTFLD